MRVQAAEQAFLQQLRAAADRVRTNLRAPLISATVTGDNELKSLAALGKVRGCMIPLPAAAWTQVNVRTTVEAHSERGLATLTTGGQGGCSGRILVVCP